MTATDEFRQFMREERDEIQRMDDLRDLEEAAREADDEDPDGIEDTNRYLESWLRRNQ